MLSHWPRARATELYFKACITSAVFDRSERSTCLGAVAAKIATHRLSSTFVFVNIGDPARPLDKAADDTPKKSRDIFTLELTVTTLKRFAFARLYCE